MAAATGSAALSTASAAPTQGSRYTHPSLSLVNNAWVTTIPIPAGTCLLREPPSSVVPAETTSPLGPDELRFGERGVLSATLPAISCTVHSCIPNTTLAAPLRWRPRCGDGVTTIITLLALHDLSAGEVLTCSRVELLLSPSERAAQLRVLLGRACTCDRCAYTGAIEVSGAGAVPASLLRLHPVDLLLTAARSSALPVDATLREAALAAMRASYSAMLTAGEGAPGLEAARAFLSGPAAACGLAATHWRVLEAHTRVIGLMLAARKWREAWELLLSGDDCHARAVFAILSPGHSDAQRVTMALGDVCIRGWQCDDPKGAWAETAGALMGGSASAARRVMAGGGGGAASTMLAVMTRAATPSRVFLEHGIL